MSLFFNESQREVSAEEAAEFERQSIIRFLSYLKSTASEALSYLPPAAREFYNVPDMQPPEWHDPCEPSHLLNEVYRIFLHLPKVLPGWIDFTEEQSQAAAVLLAISRAVRATRGLDPEKALRLLEAGTSLGHTVTRAHVAPWEPHAGRGQKVADAASKGHEKVHGTNEQKQELWSLYQQALDEKMKTNPRLSLTRAREIVAKQFCVSTKTIQRHTNKPIN